MDHQALNSLHRKIVASLISATWARAVGELNAVIALAGSTHGSEKEEDGRYRYEHIKDIVDSFIAEIEDKEYNL